MAKKEALAKTKGNAVKGKPAVGKVKNAKVGKLRKDEDDKPKKKKMGFDVNSLIHDTLDTVAKRQGIVASGLDVSPPVSSGLLMVDLVLGGGIRPGMITAAAEEQCAKTTLAITALAAAVKRDIPFLAMVDYEGSTKAAKRYVHEIFKGQGVKLKMNEIFGKESAQGGWEIQPRVRYMNMAILEHFYEWMGAVLRELPDKRFLLNEWWYIFEDNKKNRARVGDQVDAKMTKTYGNGLWVKAPDGNPQGLIVLDSYTAMNPAVKDEEDIGNQLSVKASAFSKQLERIKGRMMQKMVVVYGLNHLRDNPMAMFGPKQDEKGGKALKQFSDVRLRQTSRALSAAPFKVQETCKKTFNELERSVEYKGKDSYRYVHVKGHKNKHGTPNRDCFFRIWVEDASGTARGLDPVFDVISYLKETGQLSGQRKAFKLDLDGLGKAKIAVDWQTLKLWVLGDKEAMTEISKKLGYKPMSLRAFCFKQMEKGRAEELYVAYQGEDSKKGKDRDDDDDGDEDEDDDSED
jgi:RecA/RadA recombinase